MPPNTGAQKEAMMVPLVDAPRAHRAVMRSLRLVDLALRTVAKLATFGVGKSGTDLTKKFQTIYFHINNNFQSLYLNSYYRSYNMFMCPDKV